MWKRIWESEGIRDRVRIRVRKGCELSFVVNITFDG
jgi:hypothetical protein